MLFSCVLCWHVILDIKSQNYASFWTTVYGQNIDVLGVIGAPSSKTTAGYLK